MKYSIIYCFSCQNSINVVFHNINTLISSCNYTDYHLFTALMHLCINICIDLYIKCFDFNIHIFIFVNYHIFCYTNIYYAVLRSQNKIFTNRYSHNLMLTFIKCKSWESENLKNSRFFRCTYKLSKRFQILKK